MIEMGRREMCTLRHDLTFMLDCQQQFLFTIDLSNVWHLTVSSIMSIVLPFTVENLVQLLLLTLCTVVMTSSDPPSGTDSRSSGKQLEEPREGSQLMLTCELGSGLDVPGGLLVSSQRTVHVML